MPTLARPRALASLGALLLAALVTTGPSPRAFAEDAPTTSDEATLVVKLPRGAVREVEALVARHGGVVLDTATLRTPRRAATSSEDEPAGASVSPAAPALTSAQDILSAVHEALQQVIAEGHEGEHLRLTAVDITDRKARLIIEATETRVLDAA